MPDWKKFEQVASLTNTVRELMMIGLQDQYPTAGADELHLRFAARILGEDLAMRVYGELVSDEKDL
jgi:hypothetical protein